jgi:hypothetical protein
VGCAAHAAIAADAVGKERQGGLKGSLDAQGRPTAVAGDAAEKTQVGAGAEPTVNKKMVKSFAAPHM